MSASTVAARVKSAALSGLATVSAYTVTFPRWAAVMAFALGVVVGLIL